ncbi:MAG TPA: hypothetical protein VMA95_20505 [Streptosporangiaceae bacterium]|nr:hypothetical protein [Streptosporangiaceae bacterium]
MRATRITALTLASAALLLIPAAANAASANAASANAAAASSPAASSPKPGLTGTPIVLDNNVELSGYDAATDAAGNTYIGWISDKNNAGRKVHLCTLPPGAKKCKGGIQTIDSLGDSSAAGLKVLVSSSGEVILVWFHDTTASTMGPQGGELAVATSDMGGTLSPGFDMGSAPSFGTLLDARLGPGDKVWTVAGPPAAETGLQVRTDLQTTGNLVTVLKTPYYAGAARIRFHGSNAVLAIQKYGAITVPVDYASYKHGTWTSFAKLAHTWTSDADLGLVGTSSGIRLITSIDDASYNPVVWNWNGSSFIDGALTGDLNNCSPSSHDLVSDDSGRVADVSVECDDLAIANLPDTRHAAVVRYNAHGTFAGGDPQITTTARGKGWVAWSAESSEANKLLAAPILLPGRDVTASNSAKGNHVTVEGPQSCLPPAGIAVGVKGSPAKNWHVVSKVLRLGSSVVHSAVLNGATLTPGNSYTLSGTVKFASGGSHETVTAKLKFTSCPTGTTSG